MVLRYALSVHPSSRGYARYALELLLEGMGLPAIEVSDPGRADLVYAFARPADVPAHALWIRADLRESWTHAAVRISTFEGMPVLSGSARTRDDASGDNVVGADLVYSTFAITSGCLERTLPSNEWGVPSASSPDYAAVALLRQPIVSRYVQYLEGRLARCLPTFQERHARWPDGKTCAVVLSHDVDMPFTRPSATFYHRRLRRDMRAGRPAAAARCIAGWARVRLTQGRSMAADADPNFAFDAWREIEADLGARSGFYVGAVSAADARGDRDDVDYDFRHPALLSAMRRALDAGWEVGLHASLSAWTDPAHFVEEKARLEDVLFGHRIEGVRHHHWALHPETPEDTWWAHAAAGFSYDSSLGLNDAPGFRRGLVWPFFPFDRRSNRVVPLLQVPPTIMDAALFAGGPCSAEEAERRLLAHLEQVFAVGGAAVLNWNLEQGNGQRMQGAGPLLTRVLQAVADRSEIWWASPAQVARWWLFRRAALRRSVRESAAQPGRVRGARPGSIFASDSEEG